MRLPLAVTAALISLASMPAFASAAIQVTKTADDTGPCNSGVDCSLRAAVIAANAGAGGDTINVPAGTYTLSHTGAGEDNAATGDLDIRKGVTIVGAGSGSGGTAIAGAGDRIFDIATTAGPVTL